MINIGPYAFTEEDALHTLRDLGELWSTMLHGRRSSRAEAAGQALRARLAVITDQPEDATLARIGKTASKYLAGSPQLQVALEDVWHTLRDASETLRSDGQLPSTQRGVVTQLSSSSGGVPKLAVPAVDVNFSGVVGDVQRVRRHHGRPWQALCLFSDEVIDVFHSEGHPIRRGSVGENITVAGVAWEHVRPGVVIQIGSVVALVQAFTEPCAQNARFFLARDFNRMNIDRGPVSRVYATVLVPGRIATGDEFVLEPEQPVIR